MDAVCCGAGIEFPRLLPFLGEPAKALEAEFDLDQTALAEFLSAYSIFGWSADTSSLPASTTMAVSPG